MAIGLSWTSGTGAQTPGISSLLLISAETDNRPNFYHDLPFGNGDYRDAVVGDTEVVQYQIQSPLGSWTQYYSRALTAPVDGNATISGISALDDGEYKFRGRIERAGVSTQPAWSPEIDVLIDVTAPVILTLSPADNATNIGLASNLTVTFDETVVFGATVTINLFKQDDTLVELFDETDIGGTISLSGAVLTINPTSALEVGTSYYVQIASGSIADPYGNHIFPGIADETSWTFSTVAVEPTFTHLGTQQSGSSGAVLTLSAAAVGTAACTVIVGGGTQSTPDISSVTVGGEALSLVVASGTSGAAEIWAGAVSAGAATRDIVVTWNAGSFNNRGMSAWKAADLISSTAKDSAAITTATASNGTDTISVAAGDLVFYFGRSAAGTPTFASSTEAPTEASFSTLYTYANDDILLTNASFSVVASASGGGNFVAASFA